MSHYDDKGRTPPTFDHRIHTELVEREEEKIHDPERPETARDGESPREAAKRRVDERFGTPGPPNRRGPPLRVRPEHLADLSRGVTARIAVRDGRPLTLGGGSTIRAECPNCPRHEQSWSLFDLRHITDPLRTKLTEADLRPNGVGMGAPPGQLPPYACHACVSAWIRSGLMTKSEWLEAHGAPEERIRPFRENPDLDHRP